MTNELTEKRLLNEHKNWRKNHPAGFVARPAKKSDGTKDLFTWQCLIPGDKGSVWEGGNFYLELRFHSNFPASAPNAYFIPPIPHVNVFKSGRVCLSILTNAWQASIDIRQILTGIQKMLDEPNVSSPANHENNQNYVKNRTLYDRNIKKFIEEHNMDQLPEDPVRPWDNEGFNNIVH